MKKTDVEQRHIEVRMLLGLQRNYVVSTIQEWMGFMKAVDLLKIYVNQISIVFQIGFMEKYIFSTSFGLKLSFRLGF